MDDPVLYDELIAESIDEREVLRADDILFLNSRDPVFEDDLLPVQAGERSEITDASDSEEDITE